MSRIIHFPFDPERQSARLQALHFDHLDLEDLGAELGSPEEWLATAILHLKAQICEGDPLLTGSIPVSIAAVCLVLQRLEELEQGGEPWRGNAA
jgi:hypothetical protein